MDGENYPMIMMDPQQTYYKKPKYPSYNRRSVERRHGKYHAVGGQAV